jgi:putative transposase
MNFKELKNRHSTRLEGFDYARANSFFITLCVKEKHCMLGQIIDGEAVLSKYGEILRAEITRTPLVRPNVVIDAFVIMPNHVHMILRILGTVNESTLLCDDSSALPDVTNAFVCSAGECNSPLRSPSQTVGAIIRGMKGVVSKKIGFSLFQRGYHDIIIRDGQAYQKMKNYIKTNPKKWPEDKYFDENTNS